jgi:hypothetical protein
LEYIFIFLSGILFIMEKKEYTWPAILFLISMGFLIYASRILRNVLIDDEISSMIPGRFNGELFYILIFPSILVILISFVLGTFILRVYIFASKTTKEGDFHAAIFEYDKQFTGKMMFTRTLLPSFLSLTIGLTLDNFSDVLNFRVLQNSSSGNIILLSLLSLPIVSLFIFPIWLSEDTGVILYKKGDVKQEGINITPACDSINTLLKGWAGFSVPLQFLIAVIREVQNFNSYLMLLILLFPIALFGLYIPIQVIYMKMHSRLKNRVLRRIKLKKINIKIELEE